MSERLLIVSPVRNEAAHIERVVDAMAAQTRPPDLWLVVDDGSTDATAAKLRERARQLPFLRVLEQHPEPVGRAVRDRLAMAADARAFNHGLSQTDWRSAGYIGKLDGDVELPPHYFERLLAEFEADPRLGVAGATLVEPTRLGMRRLRIPDHHVHGAVKLYSRSCFEAIGGMEERLGWDTIDETYARMRGFRTHTLQDLVAVHRRPAASASGRLRGRARHGECAYISRYGIVWVALRSLKMATMRPVGVSGAAFLIGYLGAAARRAPRVEDEEFRRFVQGELRSRMLRPRGRAAAFRGSQDRPEQAR